MRLAVGRLRNVESQPPVEREGSGHVGDDQLDQGKAKVHDATVASTAAVSLERFGRNLMRLWPGWGIPFGNR